MAITHRTRVATGTKANDVIADSVAIKSPTVSTSHISSIAIPIIAATLTELEQTPPFVLPEIIKACDAWSAVSTI